MKKIIMTMAIVCAAFVANAASATWSISNIQGPNGGNGDIGWLVEVYNSTVTYSYDAAKAGTITELFSATTTAQGTAGAVRVNQSGVGSYAANDTGSWYAVIYDAATVDAAAHYIVSDDKSWTVNALGKDFSVAFGSMTATTTANTFLNSTWQATSSVPEPTSGLLMLLGVAGLALRRKRA